jgi:predicted transcriptional regulator of viral defense system
MELSRLAARGHLERVQRGVYQATGAPSIREEEVWCAWLSLEPTALAYARDPLACIVSHNTAAWLMGAGELNPESLTFTSAVRRQVKRDGLRVVRGRLLASEVRTVAGLPCATAARTVYDLVADGEDLSLVSAVLYDALAGGVSLYEMLKGEKRCCLSGLSTSNP